MQKTFIILAGLLLSPFSIANEKTESLKNTENWYRNSTRRPASLVQTDYYIFSSDDFKFQADDSNFHSKIYTCSTIFQGQGIPQSALEVEKENRQIGKDN